MSLMPFKVLINTCEDSEEEDKNRGQSYDDELLLLGIPFKHFQQSLFF